MNPIDVVFSQRQRAILGLVISGFGYKEIAAQFRISVRTVESHMEQMRFKVNARTTAQLIAMVCLLSPAR